MLITFTGSHSTGKTTLLTACRKEYGSKFTFVDEITRSIKQTAPINEQGSDKTQLMVLHSHLVNARLKDAILDRCIIDGYLYTRYLHTKGNVSDIVMDLACEIHTVLLPRYDIIFYTSAEGVPLVSDGVRSANTTFRSDITALFETYMQISKPSNVTKLTGTVEERMQQIKTAIK